MTDYKKDFPLLAGSDIAYLDNAATAQRPSCVLAAVQEFYEQKNANPLRGFYPLSLEATESYQEARKTVQEFIHAEEPEEIIFTRNTTESLNLVAYSYGLNFLKVGDEIAVTIMEHHSNLLPWQMVSRMTGAKLHYLECTSEGELTDEELDTIADVAISILRSILLHFDAANSPIDEYEGDEGELILDVTAPDLAVLIGRHGRTLDALQVMFSLLVSRKLGFRYPVVVDVEGYKRRRQDKVASMAQSAAERAIRTHKSVSLPPMNAYERRLVHIALRGNDAVDTHSEGSDPDRHVVIVAR